MVVGCPPTSSILILQTLDKDPLIRNILGDGGPEPRTCTRDKARGRERRRGYPLNQPLFGDRGGLKSTCRGTGARPYGFITAVQIITAQIPDMDQSCSAPAFLSLTSFPPSPSSGVCVPATHSLSEVLRHLPAFLCTSLCCLCTRQTDDLIASRKGIVDVCMRGFGCVVA